MRAPSLRLVLVLAATGLLAACGSSVAAGPGEPCGPNRGCAEGLTCASGSCVSIGVPDGGGQVTDGGTTSDGGTASDGGTVTDGGTTSDGGTVTDGGTTPDGGATCGPCDTPPDACHAAQGTCENGTCVYAPLDGTACDDGDLCTVQDTCTGGICGGTPMACDTPPDGCHATQGTCASGACTYAAIDGATCDDGNPCTVQDTCTGGTCSGSPMVCNTPQAPACTSGTQLSTYDATGVCQGGLCTYTRKTVQCTSGGCVNNACQTDPCASMACNTPPSVCYGTAGTCANGSCDYPYADGTVCNDNDACTTSDQCNTGVCKGTPVACDAPPVSSCSDANTAKIYDAVGSCSAGSCSYTYHFVTCAGGCLNGACQSSGGGGSGWTRMTSNTNVHLYAVWGSSATDVWAVGNLGTAMHWDGTQWQARPSYTTLPIISIHGTSATNVYAVARAGTTSSILHYDGIRWSTVVSGLAFYSGAPIGIFALGPGHAVVGGYASCCYANPEIKELNGTTLTVLGTATVTPYSYSAVLWASSATDVYLAAGKLVHYDGTGVTRVSGTAPGDSLSVIGFGPSDVFATADGSAEHYDGTAWSVLPTGLAGTLTGLSGTATNRVFASGYAAVTSSSLVGYVEIWDGIGWTQAPIPAGTGQLEGIFAAPNGEVFAVGNAGTIIHGP